MKDKLSNMDMALYAGTPIYKFPKYTAMLINQINQTAQGTRTKVVGQMSELMQEFKGQTAKEWEEWYNQRKPNAIKDATDKIYAQFLKISEAMSLIDRGMIEQWVKDLIYAKTFCGLRVQNAIISFIAAKFAKQYRFANTKEEAEGIDGFIGGMPVQIKPTSYKYEKHLSETIYVPIIYYDKKKDGIEIEYEADYFK